MVAPCATPTLRRLGDPVENFQRTGELGIRMKGGSVLKNEMANQGLLRNDHAAGCAD